MEGVFKSMNITQRLQELDSTFVLHNEGHWDVPLDPTKPGFTSFNDAGIETETGEFLYSMVRILKPDWVLETGTHWGVGASYMGQALKDNNYGQLDTIEFISEIYNRALLRIQTLNLQHIVNCHLGDVAKYEPSQQYKLILLDTEPQTRFAELIKFYPYLEPGGFIFIHDTPRSLCQGNINPDWPNIKSWPFGDIPVIIKTWVKENKLRPFHFQTPRGLVGFYKTHPDDVHW
jgi:hypothetical protein